MESRHLAEGLRMDTIKDDLLNGADKIAAYLGVPRTLVYRMADRGELPTFKLGRSICARRSALLRHVAALEAKQNCEGA
jgi:excisionase family DNA binding protein